MGIGQDCIKTRVRSGFIFDDLLITFTRNTANPILISIGVCTQVFCVIITERPFVIGHLVIKTCDVIVGLLVWPHNKICLIRAIVFQHSQRT